MTSTAKPDGNWSSFQIAKKMLRRKTVFISKAYAMLHALAKSIFRSKRFDGIWARCPKDCCMSQRLFFVAIYIFIYCMCVQLYIYKTAGSTYGFYQTASLTAGRASLQYHAAHPWQAQGRSQNIVAPKGVLRLAKCHASATRGGPWASSREHSPEEKLMWQASLQLETYQLSHW